MMGGRGSSSASYSAAPTVTPPSNPLRDADGKWLADYNPEGVDYQRDDFWEIEDELPFAESIGRVAKDDKIPTDTEWGDALSDWLVSSVEIRAATTGKRVSDSAKKQAEALENKILEGDGYDGAMFRGISVDSKTLKKMKPGAVIDQKGTSSWTKSKSCAEGFSYEGDGTTDNSVVFRLKRGSSKAMDFSNYNRSEVEVIMSVSSKQRITSVTRVNGITWVDLEEI